MKKDYLIPKTSVEDEMREVERIQELLKEYNYDSDGIGVVAKAIEKYVSKKCREARIDELRNIKIDTSPLKMFNILAEEKYILNCANKRIDKRISELFKESK